MAGRTPPEAVKNFARPIQDALTCFADGRVEGTEKPGYSDPKPYVGTGAATYSATLAEAVQEASEECPGECIFIEQEDGTWKVG